MSNLWNALSDSSLGENQSIYPTVSAKTNGIFTLAHPPPQKIKKSLKRWENRWNILINKKRIKERN